MLSTDSRRGYNITGQTHSSRLCILKPYPVTLHIENYDRWLEASIADAITLASPYPSQLMVMDEPADPSATT